jgi:hypothetical protein
LHRNQELIDSVAGEIDHLQQRLFTQKRNISELRVELEEESRKLRLANIGASADDAESVRDGGDDYSAASGSLAEQQRDLDGQLVVRRRELERDVAELQECVERDREKLEQSRLGHMQEVARRRDEMAVSRHRTALRKITFLYVYHSCDWF